MMSVHRSGVHYKCKEDRMCNDVEESLCDDINTKFVFNLMDIKLHVCNRTIRVMMLKTEEEEERDGTCHLESKFLTFL
jgi:hypothetical protein